MDTLVQKAWELYQLAIRVPDETILEATFRPEDKHHAEPGNGWRMTKLTLQEIIVALAAVLRCLTFAAKR